MTVPTRLLQPARFGHWLGLNGPAIHDTATEQTDVIALAVHLGVRWLRIDLGWSGLTDPDRHARALDLVDRCHARGLLVLAVIGYLPEAELPLVDHGSGDKAAPAQPWRIDTPETVTGLARLIHAGVRAVEGWNESNLPEFCSPVDPVAMADYHAGLYQAVKAAAWIAGQEVPVITGGTAPAETRGPDHLVAMLNEAGAEHVRIGDAPGHHPYAWGYDPHDAEHATAEYNALRVQTIEHAYAWAWSTGIPARVWGTEIGWPDGHRTRDRVRQDLRWWWDQARLGITGPLFIYTARSDAVTAGEDGERYGLRDVSGIRKGEIVDVIRDAAQWPLTVGLHP